MAGNRSVGYHENAGRSGRMEKVKFLLPRHGSVLGIFAEKVTLGNTQLCGCSVCCELAEMYSKFQVCWRWASTFFFLSSSGVMQVLRNRSNLS